ncbi:MAG TPA: Fe-S cluster assembly protein SufD [archaeon]|nr:Fe-S cluster assembly protein SufD [archaeon]
MTLKTQVEKGKLTEDLVREISKQKNEPKWLLDKRLEAFEKLSSLPLPQFVYGLGISIDISELNTENIDPLGSLEEKPILTDKHEKVVVSDFHQALKTHEDLIKKHMLYRQDVFENRLDALHTAFWTRGTFIYVPKGVETSVPIKHESLLTKNTQMENLLIVADPLSKLTIVDIAKSSHKETGFRSQRVDIFAKESSKIEFSCIQNLSSVFNISRRSAFMNKDASIDWIITDIGGSVTKSDATTYLQEDGSSVKNIGLFLGKEKQQFDFTIKAVHLAPHTASDMLTKGALSGRSKTIYRGYIQIKDTAPKSSGYQKADILLLSQEAEADPIPNLEIDNNDIEKCTHGATVGQIDRDKMFYMMSRGLSEKEAIKKFVEGLFEPAVNRIKLEAIQKNLTEILEKRLDEI